MQNLLVSVSSEAIPAKSSSLTGFDNRVTARVTSNSPAWFLHCAWRYDESPPASFRIRIARSHIDNCWTGRRFSRKAYYGQETQQRPHSDSHGAPGSACVFVFYLRECGLGAGSNGENRLGAHDGTHGVQRDRQDRNHQLCSRKGSAGKGRGGLSGIQPGTPEDGGPR